METQIESCCHYTLSCCRLAFSRNGGVEEVEGKSNSCVGSLRKYNLLFLGSWELDFWAAGKGKCPAWLAAGSACDNILDKEWINYKHHMQWTLNFFHIIIQLFLCC